MIEFKRVVIWIGQAVKPCYYKRYVGRQACLQLPRLFNGHVRREGTPLNEPGTHNRQKQTRREFHESRKRKGRKGFITPGVIYYLVVRPIIDVAIEWITSAGII